MRKNGPPSHHAQARPLLVALVAAAVVAHLLIAAMLMQRLAEGALVGDWTAFYAAGHLVRSGAAAHLYDPAAQAAAERALYGDVQIDAFPLPAFTALAFAPLAGLSFARAYLVWMSVNGVLLAALVLLAWRSLARAGGATRVVFVVCSVASTPMLRLLTGAQVDLFVVAALAGCCALVRSERPLRGGALLAVGLVKPHLLVGALALLAVKRQWRALGGFALAAAPLLLLPILATGVGGVRDQAALLASYPASSTDHSVAADKMVNLRGLVVGLTGANQMAAWLPVLAFASAACLYAAVRVWRARPSGDGQSWALAAVLPLICSPHVHAYTLVLLLVAAALYLQAGAEAEEAVTLDAVLASSLALTVVSFVSLFLLPIAGLAVVATFAFFVVRWPRGTSLRAQARRRIARYVALRPPAEGALPPASVATGSGGRYTGANGAIV